MTKRFVAILAGALLCAAAPAALADDMSNMPGMSGDAQSASQPSPAAPEKQAKTIKGEVIDTWCYFQEGARGLDHKACATACARHGVPMGLLDDQGNVYVLADARPHTGAGRFLKLMADRVEAKGTVISKGGLSMFYVESMKPLGKAK